MTDYYLGLSEVTVEKIKNCDSLHLEGSLRHLETRKMEHAFGAGFSVLVATVFGAMGYFVAVDTNQLELADLTPYGLSTCLSVLAVGRTYFTVRYNLACERIKEELSGRE